MVRTPPVHSTAALRSIPTPPDFLCANTKAGSAVRAALAHPRPSRSHRTARTAANTSAPGATSPLDVQRERLRARRQAAALVQTRLLRRTRAPSGGAGAAEAWAGEDAGAPPSRGDPADARRNGEAPREGAEARRCAARELRVAVALVRRAPRRSARDHTAFFTTATRAGSHCARRRRGGVGAASGERQLRARARGGRRGRRCRMASAAFARARGLVAPALPKRAAPTRRRLRAPARLLPLALLPLLSSKEMQALPDGGGGGGPSAPQPQQPPTLASAAWMRRRRRRWRAPPRGSRRPRRGPCRSACETTCSFRCRSRRLGLRCARWPAAAAREGGPRPPHSPSPRAARHASGMLLPRRRRRARPPPHSPRAHEPSSRATHTPAPAGYLVPRPA